MGCATGTIRFALFIFNALWAILGVLVIVFVGLGWDAMPTKYAIGIVVLGAVILIISFFGCFGALRESSRMMWTYVVFLLVLLVLIIVFVCFNTRDVFRKYALQGVEDHWSREKTHPGAMDVLQLTYHCCGRYSATDYIKIGRRPPATCCKESNCLNPLNQYMIGCLVKVEEAFADEAITTEYCQWGFLGFNAIILILAIILAIHFTNNRRRYNY